MKSLYKGAICAGFLVISNPMSGAIADTISSSSSFLTALHLIVDVGDTNGMVQLDETLQLHQFDPSLGTLTDVTFNLTSVLANGLELFVSGFNTPLSFPVHGLASSDYSLSLTNLFTGTLFDKSFHNEAECFLANRLLCTDTDTEHAGEIYEDSFDALPLAGYQGLGIYDVTLSQEIDIAVSGGGESLFVGGWVGDLEVVYTYSTVPVPAAVWLFGSGLTGLISIAKRKKA